MLGAKQLAIEVVMIGIMSCVLGAIIGHFYGFSDLLDKKALGVYFLIGALLHFIFEISGSNTWYCNNRKDLAA
jgi:hypothetical protein